METQWPPLSLQDRASDARGEQRLSLYLAASLYCDGVSHAVKIRNISAAGALLDSTAAFTVGALVQLVRGPLIVHALVAWTTDQRCGIKFSGTIDVQRWCEPPSNPEQDRVDEIVRVVKAGAVPLPVPMPGDSPAAAEGFSTDLRRVAQLLGQLEDRLASDCIIVAQYPTELQNLDIAMQLTHALEAIGQARGGPSPAKLANLRNSADQALRRGAAQF